jgi:hypothetical protein
MAWQLLMAHAEDDAPDPAGGAAAAAAAAAAQGAAANKQFTISRWEYPHLAACLLGRQQQQMIVYCSKIVHKDAVAAACCIDAKYLSSALAQASCSLWID